VRGTFVARREIQRRARRERRRVEHELASYATPAERRELDAILGRHSAEQVRDIEKILGAQAESRRR
jgi:hypothetical protein